MTTEQDGAPSATAGGAPAPTIPPAQVRATAEYLARMVGCYVAEVPPPLPPFKRRPVLGEPKPNMAGNEDGDTWAEGVGWALSWGCQLTFGRDEHTAVPYVQVSLSDEDRRRGITQRSATRAQVAAFARMLTEQFGEPSTVVPDPRDAEIERLRKANSGLAKERDQASAEVEELETQRDDLIEAARAKEQQLFTRFAELVNPIREVFDKQPVDASHYRELRDGINRLIVTLNAERERDTRLRGQVDELAKIRVALFGEVRSALAERDDYAGRLRDTDAAYAKATAERDHLRQELDLTAQLPAVADRDLFRSQRDEARDEREVARAENRDLRSRLNRVLEAVAGDKPPAEPRRWVAGDPEPEIGTTVWLGADKYTRSANGWHRVDIHTGYGSWAWILSVGSEVVEAVDRG